MSFYAGISRWLVWLPKINGTLSKKSNCTDCMTKTEINGRSLLIILSAGNHGSHGLGLTTV